MSFDLTRLAVLYSFPNHDVSFVSYYLNAIFHASITTQPLELCNYKKNFWIPLPLPHHSGQNFENIKPKKLGCEEKKKPKPNTI